MAKWQYCEVCWDKSDDIYITIAGTSYVDQQIAHGVEEWSKVLAMLGEDEWELTSTLTKEHLATHWYYFKRPLHNFYEGKIEGELKRKNSST